MAAGIFAWPIKIYINEHSKPVYVPEKALAYLPNLGSLPFVDFLLWVLLGCGIFFVAIAVWMFVNDKIRNCLAKRKMIKQLLSM